MSSLGELRIRIQNILTGGWTVEDVEAATVWLNRTSIVLDEPVPAFCWNDLVIVCNGQEPPVAFTLPSPFWEEQIVACAARPYFTFNDPPTADTTAPTFAKPLAPLPEWLRKVGGIVEEVTK